MLNNDKCSRFAQLYGTLIKNCFTRMNIETGHST